MYTVDARMQSWLEVEAALAQAQAEVGMIPAEAAAIITKNAHLDLLDRERIAESARRTEHTIVPLVWELARVCGEEAGGWVHWGATTQNIVQTGDLLVMRKTHRIFLGLIADALAAMSDLAERGAEMAMAGRTHGQHAVPITFGFKVAVWIDELIRHVDRLREVEPRIFVAMLGGAAGTFASFGDQGPAVQAAMADRLEMAEMRVPGRAISDHEAEYVCVLGLLASTVGKIGREVYTLMKTEFAELEEPVPPGKVGSSTMPQKRNPHLCQDIISAAAMVRGTVPSALEAAQSEHEADRAMSLIMRDATERACLATGDSLARLVVVLQGLKVNPERMRHNLDASNGLIMAESVMLSLGRDIGRQTAHDVVYEASQAAAVGDRSFADLLLADSRVTDHVTAEAVTELLDPERYTGLSSQLARTSAARGREVAAAIHSGSATPTG